MSEALYKIGDQYSPFLTPFNAHRLPVVHDGCGVFGVLAREGTPLITSEDTVIAIECARFRGSPFGAGFAAFHLTGRTEDLPLVKIFVQDAESVQGIRAVLDVYEPHGLYLREEKFSETVGLSAMSVWEASIDCSDTDLLFEALMHLDAVMQKGSRMQARVFSSGRYVTVFKDVGYPIDVARAYQLLDSNLSAQAWIAHTRQPTNSPGGLPVWSHPFSLFEWAIVHNGDVSSFGSNMSYLQGHGYSSFVGTDSEVITYLLDHLVRHTGLSVHDAATVLTMPYERFWARLPDGPEKTYFRDLSRGYTGANLDGPFVVVAGYADEHDTYMLGLMDRSKFRPILVGEDENRFYLASEECQIRSISPNARIWTPVPGSFVLASARQGWIATGREPDRKYFYGDYLPTKIAPLNDAKVIDATGYDHTQLNEKVRQALADGSREVHVQNIKGQRYLGVGIPSDAKLFLYGTPGNCLANYNNGNEITVYGNVADDMGDTMHAGRIVVHGSARDVVGQALQGGSILIRGSVGNRAAILMREYADKRPYLIIGGRADDYFGEYMAGGIAMVLGLDTIDSNGGQLVGDIVGTGMLGGRIYIRGKVRQDSIGYLPNPIDVQNYLEALLLDQQIDSNTYRSILQQRPITLGLLQEHLEETALKRIRRLFEGKYHLPLQVRYGLLDGDDLPFLENALCDFFNTFELDSKLYEKVLRSPFTRITPYPKSTCPPVGDR